MSLSRTLTNFIRSRKYTSYKQVGPDPSNERIQGSVNFAIFQKQNDKPDLCLISLDGPKTELELTHMITHELKSLAPKGCLIVYGAIPSTTARLRQVGHAPLALWKLFSTWADKAYSKGRATTGHNMPHLYSAILYNKEVFVLDFGGFQQLADKYMPAPYFEPQSEAQVSEALIQAVKGKANTIGFISSVSSNHASPDPKAGIMKPAEFAAWYLKEINPSPKQEPNATEPKPQDVVRTDTDSNTGLATPKAGKNSRNNKGLDSTDEAEQA